MKKLFEFLIFSLSLFFTRPVFAGNDITITCNPGSDCTKSSELPIFNETNIYPGFTFSQQFFVDNNRNGTCNLTLKATSNSESNLLSQKILLSIIGTNNDNDLNISNYLLSDLLDSSKPNLSIGHINKNKKNNYLWSVTLDRSADNNYQNLNSNFNVNFNFQCDEESADNPGNVLGTSTGTTSNPGAPQCTNSVPSAPTGFYATEYSGGSVTLHWNHTVSDHSGYLIAFGTSPGNYQYGAPNIGNDDHYTVRGLTPNAQYCFYVRSLNGCMPGERTPEYCINPGSNIIAANTTPDGFQPGVLGVTTDNQSSDETTDGTDKNVGEILGESVAVCQKQWLPLLFLLAFLINFIVISRFSPNWFVLFLFPAITLLIDYIFSKNNCCYGQKWLCNYYWIGNILSFLIPLILSKKRTN
ncbi:MAG: fibronectin type III domain-containing protein [Candidatus Shapirobacteria bacterium]|nr:fibronectin type III domain-containing protein [Candidatus Shapirobacteria bacterium]